jgi:hypothetical protein
MYTQSTLLLQLSKMKAKANKLPGMFSMIQVRLPADSGHFASERTCIAKVAPVARPVALTVVITPAPQLGDWQPATS